MDPARELAQLVEAGLQLGRRLVEQRRELGQPVGPLAGDPQPHRRARRAATGPRRAGRARAAGARRRRLRRGASATRAAPRSARAARPTGAGSRAPARRRAGRPDQLRLVRQRRVVRDRGDPPAVDLDLGPRAVGQRDRAALGVDEPLGLGQPVGERQRRVAERGRRARCAAPAGSGACPSRATSSETAVACARRLRSSAARNANGTSATAPARPLEPLLPRAGGVEPLRDAEDARSPPRPSTGTGASARRCGGVAAPLAAHQQHGSSRDRDHGRDVLQRVEPIRELLVGLDHEQVARASSSNSSDGICSTVTIAVRRRHDDALGAGAQAAASGTASRRCRRPRTYSASSAMPIVNRRSSFAALRPAREPREPDRGHQRAGAVARPPPPREQAGPDERPPDEQAERRDQPRSCSWPLVSVTARTNSPHPAPAPARATRKRAGTSGGAGGIAPYAAGSAVSIRASTACSSRRR